VPLFNEPQVRVILLDIEGTTTPVEFVTTVLFPYARRAFEQFLLDKRDDPRIAALIQDLRAQHEEDSRNNMLPPEWEDDPLDARVQSAVAYGRWLMDRDSKCTPLKALQGMIWEAGYASGELRGQVYEDVPRAFQRWREQKREIVIYSSGSVLAQRLLFSTTIHGDLTKFIGNYFDTRVGVKVDAASYHAIAKSLSRAASEVLFISDSPREVQAARGAGMRSLLCERSKSSGGTPSDAGLIHSFDVVYPA